MKETLNYSLELFEYNDKFDYRVINRNIVRIDDLIKNFTGGFDTEQVKSAVNEYLKNNSIDVNLSKHATKNDLNKIKAAFETVTETITLIKTQQIQFTLNGTGDYNAIIENVSPMIEEGETYKISFDGMEYECIADANTGTNIIEMKNDVFTIMCIPGSDGTSFTCMVVVKTGTTHTFGMVNIKETIAKVKSEYLPNGTGGVSSWNDLEGKPFYSEDGGEIDLLPSQELVFNNGEYTTTSKTFSYELGKTYKIEFDGITYECICQSIVDGDVEVYVVGNMSFMGAGNDTGEPFISAMNNGMNLFAIMTTDTTTPTHTVRIYQGVEIVHKLDMKYIDTDAIKDIVNDVITSALNTEV